MVNQFKPAVVLTLLVGLAACVSDSQPNVAPAVYAGSNQTVDEQSQVTLDGSASEDTDATIVSYHWNQTSGTTVTLDDAAVASPSFTSPTLTTQQTLIFSLTVTDNEGASDNAMVIITVNPVNAAPTSNAGSNQTVGEQSQITLDGSASEDTDGTIFSYQWIQTSGDSVTLDDATVANPSFTSSILTTQQTLIFSLTVTDNEGASDTGIVSITVQPQPSIELIVESTSIAKIESSDLNGGLKGMLIAQKPIVNLGYVCGYGETLKEGKTASDDTQFDYATFDCPVLSDSIVFYIGSSIGNGLVIGSFPFYDLEVKALNTISLVDFIDANELLTYEHPYVTNLALFLDAVTVRDHQGAMNEVMRIPDIVNDQVSSWVVRQGLEFDSTTDFFVRLPWMLGEDLLVRQFQKEVVTTVNDEGQPKDEIKGLANLVTYFTENIDSTVSDLQVGGRVLYTGIYPTSLLSIFDQSNIVNGDLGLYIDRAGRTFGYGTLVDYDTSDADKGELGSDELEILYFKNKEHKLTDDGILDNALFLQGLTTDTQLDLTGRMIRRILFHGKYNFSEILPLYNFHTLTDEDAGRFTSDINRHNLSYFGAAAMEQEKQVAPLIPQPILSSFDFPLHYSMTLYKKPWFHEGWAADDERLKLTTLSVTFLKDGNVITDLDGDCAAVDFDTLEEVESADVITEVPLGFLGHGSSLDLGPLLLEESDRTAEQRALLESIAGDGEELQFVTVALNFSHERIVGLGNSTGLPEAYELEAQMGLELYGSLSTKTWQLFDSGESLLTLDWYNKKRVYIELSQALSDVWVANDDETIFRIAEDIGYEGIIKGMRRSCNAP